MFSDSSNLMLTLLTSIELLALSIVINIFLLIRSRKKKAYQKSFDLKRQEFEEYLEEQIAHYLEKIEAVEDSDSEMDDIEKKVIKEANSARLKFYQKALTGMKESKGDSRGFWNHICMDFDNHLNDQLEKRKDLEISQQTLSEQYETIKDSADKYKEKVDELEIKVGEAEVQVNAGNEKLKQEHEDLLSEKASLDEEFSNLDAAHKDLQQKYEHLEQEYAALYESQAAEAEKQSASG